jgi:hypothetical protein
MDAIGRAAALRYAAGALSTSPQCALPEIATPGATMPDTVNPQITDAAVTAFPTPVNSQITDAVTQANVKVIAESPAMAMGSIYQALAHSTGILFENAVSQQQQQSITAQATTVTGVVQIYTVDTISDVNGTGTVTSPGAASIDTVQAARKAMAAVSSQITDAVKFSNDAVLSHSGDIAYGVRAACDALASAIERVNHVNQKNLLDTVKLAARAACLAGMVREPEKAAAYQDVLAAIDALG